MDMNRAGGPCVPGKDRADRASQTFLLAQWNPVGTVEITETLQATLSEVVCGQIVAVGHGTHC